MAMTPLPTPPSRSDSDNFAERGDAFLAALPAFVTEANALQDDVTQKQESAADAAQTAINKAAEAVSARDMAATKRDEAVQAQNAAHTSELNAAGSEAAALGYKNQAQDILTASNLPASLVGKALNWLRVKSDMSGYEHRTPSQVRSDIGAMSISRVTGLTGAPNSAIPLMKYDLKADAVLLRDVNGATQSVYNTGTLTCDLGLAGAGASIGTANGRDQFAALPANSWIYLYFIWNGTTLATLASLTAPASFTGSTLPTGYTHWAYATVLRWNAASNIVPCDSRGANFDYDGNLPQILNSGAAIAFTALSLAGSVPPNALRVKLAVTLAVTHSTTLEFFVSLRRNGSSSAARVVADLVTIGSGITTNAISVVEMPVTPSLQVDYQLSSTPSMNGGIYIRVVGFTTQNGDS